MIHYWLQYSQIYHKNMQVVELVIATEAYHLSQGSDFVGMPMTLQIYCATWICLFLSSLWLSLNSTRGCFICHGQALAITCLSPKFISPQPKLSRLRCTHGFTFCNRIQIKNRPSCFKHHHEKINRLTFWYWKVW